MTLAYSFLLVLSLIVLTPQMLYQVIVKKKYRKSFFKRLGLFQRTPSQTSSNRLRLWIHAVSLGECKTAQSLIHKILEKEPKAHILFSHTTETGFSEGQRLFSRPNFTHIYQPIDFKFILRPIIKRFKPHGAIVVESDFWWNFLSLIKKSGAWSILVNGKLSSTSFKRFKSLPSFSRKLFHLFDELLIQDEVYLKRFVELKGNTNHCMVTGNLKWDPKEIQYDSAILEKLKRALNPSAPTLTLGSTHRNEERLILEQINPLIQSGLQVVVVPRHPERFKSVESELKQIGYKVTLYSELENDVRQSKPEILLVDEMGILMHCYKVSDVGLVGGSFIENVGGHNILEPLFAGIPTLFGPSMYGQKEMLHAVLNAKAGTQSSLKKLKEDLLRLLENENARSKMIERGANLVHSMKGSLKKTWEILELRL